MDTVTLPPDLERFVADVVAQGRYSDLDDVMRAAVSLLQRAETERATFIVSLEEAQAEAERDGFSTLDEVLQEMDEIIAAAELRHG
jgi:antitoxin ParD1/3/4